MRWPLKNFCVCRGTFVDAEAQLLCHERLNAVEEEIVEPGAGLASYFNGIFEALRRDEGGACAFALQQSIGSHGRAVKENEVSAERNFAGGFDNGLRGIGGAGEDLEHSQLSTVHPDTVGEGAAGVDGDAERLGAHDRESGELG